jgi:hypothetical protein
MQEEQFKMLELVMEKQQQQQFQNPWFPHPAYLHFYPGMYGGNMIPQPQGIPQPQHSYVQ